MNDIKDYNYYPDKAKIDEFLKKYEKTESRNRYEATIKEFVHLTYYKRIREISKDQLKNYYEIVKDNAAKISHLREYFKFLIWKNYLNAEITGDGKFVEWVYKFKPVLKDKNRPAIVYPLNTILQIDYDIKTNYCNPTRDNKREYERILKIAFIWELLFDAGVSVGNLKLVKTKYLFDKQSYLDAKTNNLIVDMYYENDENIIKSIVIKYYYTLLDELYKKPKRDGFYELECLEYYKNDELQVYGLLPQDIQEARKKLYTKCHNCGTEHKISPSNWIIVQLKESPDKYIVCNTCKGKSLYGK